MLVDGYKNVVRGAIEVATPTRMEAYIDSLTEASQNTTKVFFEGKEYDVPLAAIVYDTDEDGNILGIGIVTLNMPLWGSPYYSVDMLVSTSRKTLFRLLHELMKIHIAAYRSDDFPKLPIMVETKYGPLLRRYFSKLLKLCNSVEQIKLFDISMLKFS